MIDNSDDPSVEIVAYIENNADTMRWEDEIDYDNENDIPNISHILGNIPSPDPIVKQSSEITDPVWSARCDCYKWHNSASGRCNARDIEVSARQYLSDNRRCLCEGCHKNCK